jgi:hypothetical protein
MARERVDRILEFRRHFLREAIQLTGDRGLPATGHGSATHEPDLLTTALGLPACTSALQTPALARIIGELLEAQLPDGSFPLSREDSEGSPLVTALALHGLTSVGSAPYSSLIDLAGRRAGDWVLRYLNAQAAGWDRSSEVLAALLVALADHTDVVTRDEPREALNWLASTAVERIDAYDETVERLWLGRGLIAAFTAVGNASWLKAVEDLVTTIAETHDVAGQIGARLSDPQGARGAAWTQALFADLAARIGRPELTARIVTWLAHELSPTGFYPPLTEATSPAPSGLDAIAGSDVRIALVIHDTMCQFAATALSRPQTLVRHRAATAPSGSAVAPVRRPDEAPCFDDAPCVVSLSQEAMDHIVPHRRVAAPLEALARSGRIHYLPGTAVSGPFVSVCEDRVRSADVLVRHRFGLDNAHAESCRRLMEAPSTPVIFEVDDMLVEPANVRVPGGTTWETSQIIDAIRTATLVTAPSRSIAQGILELGAAQVVVVPETINPAEWSAPDPTTIADRPTS